MVTDLFDTEFSDTWVKRTKESVKFVLTNDDGYNEPGLVELARQVKPMGDVSIVAPKYPQSITGHRVTLKYPIAVEQVSEVEYIVDGSPADCTRLALKQFMPDVEWVIAGINPGANLGTDVYQSGTVAAAREAAMLGCKAIAVSQYIAPEQKIDWKITGQHVARILSIVMGKNQNPGEFWNINLPHPISESVNPVYELCERDKNPHEFDFEKKGNQYSYSGIFHNRPRTKGFDVDVCLSGKIAVSRLKI